MSRFCISPEEKAAYKAKIAEEENKYKGMSRSEHILSVYPLMRKAVLLSLIKAAGKSKNKYVSFSDIYSEYKELADKVESDHPLATSIQSVSDALSALDCYGTLESRKRRGAGSSKTPQNCEYRLYVSDELSVDIALKGLSHEPLLVPLMNKIDADD